MKTAKKTVFIKTGGMTLTEARQAIMQRYEGGYLNHHDLRLILESYAKEHAIEFALYSDSENEECLIEMDAIPDIKGECIEEKCYRAFVKSKQQ